MSTSTNHPTRGRTASKVHKPLALLLCLLLLPAASIQAATEDVGGIGTPNVLPPDTPSQPSPPHGAGPLGLDMTLSWTGGDLDSEVVHYTVYLGAGAPTTAVCTRTTATSCAVTGLEYATTYQWQVQAEDEDKETWGPRWSFTTKQAPEVPHDPAAADGAVGVARTSTLSWQGDDPDGFPLTFTVLLENTTAPTATRCGPQSARTCGTGLLGPLETYAWQVLVDDGYRTTPGPVWTFTTAANVAPDVPTLVAPGDGAGPLHNEVTFQWSGGDAEGDPVAYTVHLSDATQPDFGVCTTQESSCTVEVDLGQAYSWKVSAYDGYDESVSASRTFSVRTNDMPAVSYAAPADGAEEVPRSTTLRFDATDADGDAVDLDVHFGTDPQGLDLRCSGVGISSCSVSGLERGTRYFWRVDASDGIADVHGHTAVFTTVRNQPPVIELPDPVDRARDLATAPILTWTASDADGDALRYSVSLGAHDVFDRQPVPGCQSITVSTCTVTGLDHDTTYFWHVEAWDGFDTTHGDVHQFRTRSTLPPLAAAAPAPAVGALSVEDPTLTWSGSDPDGDPLTYTVYADPWDATPQTPVPGCVDVAATACPLGGLEASARYHWRVETSDGRFTVDGPVWTFFTQFDGTGDVTADDFSALPSFTKSEERVFSEVAWNPVAQAIGLKSDGRDGGDEILTKPLAAPLTRDESWSVAVDWTFVSLGEDQEAALIYLGTPDIADFDNAAANALYFRYSHSSGSGGGSGGSHDNEFEFKRPAMQAMSTSDGPTFNPVPDDAYTLHLTYDAPTRAFEMRITPKGSSQVLTQVTSTIAPTDVFGPFPGIGFGSVGQDKEVTDTDEPLEVLLDNLVVVRGDALGGPAARSIAPAPGSQDVPTTTTVTWEPLLGAPSYTVYVDSVDPPSTVACTGATDACDVSGLAVGTEHYLSIVPDGGTIAAAGVHAFRTAAPNQAPDAPVLTAPASGADLPMTPRIEWTGSDPDGDRLTYEVYFGRQGEAQELVCRTQLTLCQLGVKEWGQEYTWQVVADDGTLTTPGTQSSGGTVFPTVTYYGDGTCTSSGELGVPKAACGWSFVTTPGGSLHTNTASVTVTMTRTGSTTSEPVGVGYQGYNVGLIPSNAGVGATFSMTFSMTGFNLNSPGLGCSTSLSFTTQGDALGTHKAQIFTTGSSLETYTSTRAIVNFGATSSAKTWNGYVNTCTSSDTYVEISPPSGSLDFAAEDLTGHLNSLPSKIEVRLHKDSNDAYVDVDLNNGGTSIDGWVDLSSYGRITVTDLLRYWKGEAHFSSGKITKACASASGGSYTYRGMDVYYDKDQGDRRVRVDVDNLRYISLCAYPTSKVLDGDVSFAYSGSTNYGTVNLYASGPLPSGSTWSILASTVQNLRDVDLYVRADQQDIQLDFSYSGRVDVDVLVPGLGSLDLDRVPNQINVRVLSNAGKLDWAWFSFSSGGSGTDVRLHEDLSDIAGYLAVENVKSGYFYFDDGGSTLFEGSLTFYGTTGYVDVIFWNSRLLVDVDGTGINNLFAKATNGLVEAGGYLRDCSQGCGSLMVRVHYTLFSWSGATVETGLKRLSDGRVRFIVPVFSDPEVPVGTCYYYSSWLLPVDIRLCARNYQ